MKFTLSWLKDHLETGASLDQIVEKLTMIGLEVESVDDKAALKPFVIARVLTAEKHPDADKLRVLSVDTGSGDPIQVVCGAPNARAGLVGAFAAPGTYVPGIDTTLSVGNIRGVESRGMMCSERELMLSDEHDGIIDIVGDAPVGTPFATWAGLDDPVIEIGLTPNRPDATGVYGIARDLAAAGLGTLKQGAMMPVAGQGPCPVKVTIEAPDLCPGFALRLVRGVKNGPSPKWLQQRLLAIGLRPINALVDITNYITFDRGRPLHVFDAAKVNGNLTVRRAQDGEKVLGLDEREYELTSEMCVIADANGVESIAGIMGGEHSGCDENTTDVLVESALWNPIATARTGRELGIVTDARYRFERGVDPEFMVPGLELATKMVVDLCGGTPSESEVVGYEGYAPKTVSFPLSEVKRLTGIEVPRAESLAILERLGFKPSGEGDTVDVSVPSWRPDIEGKADLVEEVMRIHGVDEIAPALGLDGIDDDDSVLPLVHRAAAGLDARGVVALIAGRRHVVRLDHRAAAAHLALDVDPAVAVKRLRRRIAGEVVADVLVLRGEKAAVAVLALGDVDDQVPLLHLRASIRMALRPAPVGQARFNSSKVSVQGSISSRQELAAMPSVPICCGRGEVSTLAQPERSTSRPWPSR